VTVVTFLEFDPAIIALFVAMVALLCVSAMMSASETALFSLSPANMAEVHGKRSRADQSILRLNSMQDYMLATILIVNNLVNIFIILIANRIIDLAARFDSGVWEFIIKTVVVTFILLLFGEIMPKIYAAYNPLRCARLISTPLLTLKSVFKPFAWVLISSGNVVSRSLARKRGGISIDELSNAMEMTRNQTEEERRMLSGIVSFVNTDVERIMRPRVDMVTLDAGDDFAKVREVITGSGFSRIPVCEGSIDNVRGVLYVKDLVTHKDKGADYKWQSLLRKPYFVPEHKKINDLLEEFRSKHVHLAIVADEYGSTVGLVTLEDILEEIVGEISDESDARQSAGYERLDDNTWLFDGKTHLDEFLKIAGQNEDLLNDVRGGAETLAGLMLEVKKEFLRAGESITVRGLRLTARSLTGHRIDKVKVKLK
jgi:gliding motility-associated protein GldE